MSVWSEQYKRLKLVLRSWFSSDEDQFKSFSKVSRQSLREEIAEAIIDIVVTRVLTKTITCYKDIITS